MTLGAGRRPGRRTGRGGLRWGVAFVVAGWAAAPWVGPARAHEGEADTRPPALREVAFDQRVNQPVPLDLVFRDEAGRTARLGDYFGARPVILVPVYYHCQNLCPLVLDGLVRALRAISFKPGSEFDVMAVSFDPRDDPAVAAAKKADLMGRYARPETAAGWHLLTGGEGAIRRLTQAIGFRYTYDAATGQYAHASGIVILTPHGKIFRYMYGIEFSPRDLRLSVVEASSNALGSPIDQALLFCYHYDPATGKYSLMVMNLVRLAGAATVLAFGVFVAVMWRRDRRRAVEAGGRA